MLRSYDFEHFEAERAIEDYYSVGPEPWSDEIEGAAYTAWINACEAAKDSLNPKQTHVLGWMYGERAIVRTLENNHPPEGHRVVSGESLISGIIRDFTKAEACFKRAEEAMDNPIDASIVRIDRSSIPILRHIYLPSSYPITLEERIASADVQRESTFASLEYYKRLKDPRDIPHLNLLLGHILLHQKVSGKGIDAIAAPIRCREGDDAHYKNWQVMLWKDHTMHRMQFSPKGSQGRAIVIEPDMLANHSYKTSHGQGGLEAFAFLLRSKDCSSNAYAKAYDYLENAGSAIRERITYSGDQWRPIDISPEEATKWYDALPPHADPTERTYKSALWKFIIENTTRRESVRLPLEDDWRLAWMCIESGNSQHALYNLSFAKDRQKYFKAAEHIFYEIADRYPASHIDRYKALLAATTASVYNAMLCGDGDPGILYKEQLCTIGDEMLHTYDQYKNKKSSEARELASLLQELTLCLSPLMDTHTPECIVLPAAPRQRSREKQHHYDYTVWTRRKFQRYAPGQFTVRFSEQPGNESLDMRVLSFQPKRLLQSKPEHNFGTLRALLGGAHLKALGAKQAKAQQMCQKAQDDIRRFLAVVTYRQ
jgi:hypothetical protein